MWFFKGDFCSLLLKRIDVCKRHKKLEHCLSCSCARDLTISSSHFFFILKSFAAQKGEKKMRELERKNQYIYGCKGGKKKKLHISILPRCVRLVFWDTSKLLMRWSILKHVREERSHSSVAAVCRDYDKIFTARNSKREWERERNLQLPGYLEGNIRKRRKKIAWSWLG